MPAVCWAKKGVYRSRGKGRLAYGRTSDTPTPLTIQQTFILSVSVKVHVYDLFEPDILVHPSTHPQSLGARVGSGTGYSQSFGGFRYSLGHPTFQAPRTKGQRPRPPHRLPTCVDPYRHADCEEHFVCKADDPENLRRDKELYTAFPVTFTRKIYEDKKESTHTLAPCHNSTTPPQKDEQRTGEEGREVGIVPE